MAFKLLIAEKPSVAASIAKIVGANSPHREKATGYLEGNGYRVTWAFGHLVGLNKPEDMGFGGGVLPMIPDQWKTHIIQTSNKELSAMTNKQMKLLEGLFNTASEIIVATDAGREGELIFRYIYEYLGCKTPFKRLWISSLTDEAIRNGMSALIPGSKMDALSEAAHARSEADWLVGFNASRALRISTGYKGTLSLGRVQTPVLCMICDRYEQNKNFVPVPYWQVTALVHKDMTNVPVITETKYQSAEDAEHIRAAVDANKNFIVKNIEKKDVVSKQPLLYDLTALQRAANSKYGLTADDTLKTAQALYEKKYLSYPRTGSRYIPEDVFKEIPDLLQKIQSYGRQSFNDCAAALKGKKLCRRSVDDSKVTDHHALLPTNVVPTSLSGNEKLIWELVCGRMIEAFGEESVSERTSIEFECCNVKFKTTGSVMKKPGWKAVFGVNENEAEQKGSSEGGDGEEELNAGMLPKFVQGETVPGTKVETVRKETKPQPIYTDSSLLGEMETCGKKIEDDELRESMKDVGLGTPATRAATIEVLIQRGYINRTGKKLIPTELGITIAETVKGRKIADVKTTGEWERELSFIEGGKKAKKEFDEAIKQYVLDIIADLQANCKPLEGVSATTEPERICPCCGAKMKNLQYSVFCDNSAGGCGLKIPREIAGKKLPASAIDALAEGKDTQTIKGFKSKNTGKPFDAALTLNKADRKIEYKFAAAPVLAGRTCPCCGQTMADDKWKLSCTCGMTIFKSYGGQGLTEKEIDQMLAGKGVLKKGMTNKEGKKYDATLTIDTNEKKVKFTFQNKKK